MGNEECRSVARRSGEVVGGTVKINEERREWGQNLRQNWPFPLLPWKNRLNKFLRLCFTLGTKSMTFLKLF